jgi:putative DNA primase/helicase
MTQHNPITPELLRSALGHVSALLARDEWAKVAMAIKSEYPDETGLDLFDAWSQTAGDVYKRQSHPRHLEERSCQRWGDGGHTAAPWPNKTAGRHPRASNRPASPALKPPPVWPVNVPSVHRQNKPASRPHRPMQPKPPPTCGPAPATPETAPTWHAKALPVWACATCQMARCWCPCATLTGCCGTCNASPHKKPPDGTDKRYGPPRVKGGRKQGPFGTCWVHCPCPMLLALLVPCLMPLLWCCWLKATPQRPACT